MQAITPGPRSKVEFIKKTKTKKLDQSKSKKGGEGLLCLKKNTCFERNEFKGTVWAGQLIVVSVESMRSLMRLFTLIIKVKKQKNKKKAKKNMGTVLSLNCIY